MATRAGHKHKLVFCKGLPFYKFGRCREYGESHGFKCKKTKNSTCEFVVHKRCAKQSKVLWTCVYSRGRFAFEANSEHKTYTCTACEKPIKGCFYRGRKLPHMRLHPLCIKLPSRVYSPAHRHPLFLVSAGGLYTCKHCNKWGNRVWRYQCKKSAFKFVVDLHCAKRDIHGIPMTRRAIIHVVQNTLRLLGIFVPSIGSAVDEVIGGDTGKLVNTLCQVAGAAAQFAEYATQFRGKKQ